ncbi:unnamed protein product [Amoebophrya sp. A25]|nr:unnamed protein product [Amoebophrya sp. A25]|eukprot:GSA25T00023478001.1
MQNHETGENFLMHNRDMGLLLSRELASLAYYWTGVCLKMIPAQPYTRQGIGYVFATCLSDLGHVSVENFADERRNFVHGPEAGREFFEETNPIMRKCLFAIGPLPKGRAGNRMYYDIESNLTWARWHQGVDCKGDTDLGRYTFKDLAGNVQPYYSDEVKLAIWRCGQDRYQRLDTQEVDKYCAARSPREGEGSVREEVFFDTRIVAKKDYRPRLDPQLQRKMQVVLEQNRSAGGGGTTRETTTEQQIRQMKQTRGKKSPEEALALRNLRRTSGGAGASDTRVLVQTGSRSGSILDEELLLGGASGSAMQSLLVESSPSFSSAGELLQYQAERTRGIDPSVYAVQLLPSHSVDVPMFSRSPVGYLNVVKEVALAEPKGDQEEVVEGGNKSNDTTTMTSAALGVENGKIASSSSSDGEVGSSPNTTEEPLVSELQPSSAPIVLVATGRSTVAEPESRKGVFNGSDLFGIQAAASGLPLATKEHINDFREAARQVFSYSPEGAASSSPSTLSSSSKQSSSAGLSISKNGNSEEDDQKIKIASTDVQSGPFRPVSSGELNSLGLQAELKPEPPYFLCIFVPVSFRKTAYVETARAARDTWAKNSTDVRVFFLEPPGGISSVSSSIAHDDIPTVVFPEDLETDYAHLPLRTFRMFEVLGRHPVYRDMCHWYMKADADSHVHTQALLERLTCFGDTRRHWFVGVPQVAEGRYGRNSFFASGGGGYFLSRGLVQKAGVWSSFCLLESIRGVGGAGMEDVLFAGCLRKWGHVQVAQYGLDSEFSTDTRRHFAFRTKEQPARKCRFVTHSLTAREIFRVHRWRYRGLCPVDGEELATDAMVVSYSTTGELLKAPKFRTPEYRALYQCSMRRVEPVVEMTSSAPSGTGTSTSKSTTCLGGVPLISAEDEGQDGFPVDAAETSSASSSVVSSGASSPSALLHSTMVALAQRAYVRGARCVDSRGYFSFSRKVVNSEVGDAGSASIAWFLDYGNSTARFPQRCLEGGRNCLD